MRISVLCENTAYKKEFEGEHGLSLLISTDKHKILFDAGQTDLFLRNGARLGEDLKDVDMVVLSHGHYDHGGGLFKFLSLNDKAKVYINKNVANEKMVKLSLEATKNTKKDTKIYRNATKKYFFRCIFVA